MIGTAKGLAALGLIVAAMLWSIAVGVQAQTSAEAAVRRPTIKAILGAAHIILVPLMVAGMAYYVYGFTRID